MGEYDFIAASFIIAVWGDCFNLYKLKLSVCRSEKASPSPIADATSEGLMLSGFVRRDGGGLLGLELRLDEELLDADERTLGDLA